MSRSSAISLTSLFLLASCGSPSGSAPRDPNFVDCPQCFRTIEMVRTGPRLQERTAERFHQDRCAECGQTLTFSMCDGQLMVARSGSDAWIACDLCSPPPAPPR